MNRYIIHTTTVLALALVSSANSVMAEKRFHYFELPESGIYLVIPITVEEIESAKKNADAGNDVPMATRIFRVKKQKRWLERVELPESGNYLDFSMTEEEIRLAKKSEDANKAQFVADRASTFKKQKRWIEKLELPESGIYIEFEMFKEQIQVANQ